MLKHNLTLALRNFWNKRIYSVVIILSLVAGFVCSSILIAFLVYEDSTDEFHAKGERIFQIFSDDPFKGSGRIPYIPKPFTDHLVSDYPEVESVCQLTKLSGAIIDVKYRDFVVVSADTAFFTFFDFPFIEGQRNTCVAPGRIVLSEETARIIFNRTDVLDEIVTVATADTLVQLAVSAVVSMPAENSHLEFDAIVHPTVVRRWYVGVSYALLHESSAQAQLEKKIAANVNRPSLMGPGKADYIIRPLAESYFNANNAPFMKKRSPVFINVVYVVCGVVLFIASFNFINLFLLFGQSRKKEIGIKKMLGVAPITLLSFCLIEAAVYIVISVLIALLMVSLLLPHFNYVFESNLAARYFLKLQVIGPIAGVLLLSGIAVVCIAVLKQWRMKPISLIAKNASKVRFSRALFTSQFIISITLAICSITIIQQMHHIENAPLGFNRDLIQINAPGFKYSELLPVLKEKIRLLPGVNNVTVSGGNPISGNAIVRLELENGQSYSPYLFSGDEDFLKTLNFEIIEGSIPSKQNKGNLVNKALVRQFGLVEPVGAKTPGTDGVIIGVVKDFTIGSFKEQIPPVLISYHENGRALLVDYSGNNLTQLIPQLQREWHNVFTDDSFDFQILQVDLIKKYKDEIFLFKIVITFSIISILLSCFGLFALSWAVIQSRTKEIGLRKVLGASSIDILNLLTVSFTKRIGLAFLVAAPIGYYFMNGWLEGFVNRIDLNAWTFIISAVIMIIVSALTLSIQTIKATMTNPVDEIRNE